MTQNRSHEVTEADVNRAAARAFGHESPDPAKGGDRGLKGVIDELREEAAEAQHAAPWRKECPWGEREALRKAEDRLSDLYSTRRGESIESARRTAYATLREAWDHPNGMGLTQDRFEAVIRALKENTTRLEALPPITPRSEATHRQPARPINIVKEVRR